MAGKESGNASRLVYLDLCALNRPLDNQEQMRVRLESDAVALILSNARAARLTLVVSPMHGVEIRANPDIRKREHLQLLMAELGVSLPFNAAQARTRARQLRSIGVGAADAAHAALAEEMNADFVTVDDRLLRRLRRAKVTVWFGSPLAYCEKEDLR